jgi:serine protease Do
MSTEPNAGESRERRATDGLDWVPSAAPPGGIDSGADQAAHSIAGPLVDRPEEEPRPAKGGFGKAFVVAIAAGAAIIGGLVAGGTVALVGGDDSGSSQQATVAASTTPSQLTVQQTSAITEVANKVRSGVVRVESTHRTQGGIEHDVGSGIVFDTGGHILTNAHVVAKADTIVVILSDGTKRPAILLGDDAPYTDLAVLQIGPGGLQPIQAGDSGALQLGETVVAIGNPLAEFDGSVTVGVVSGLNRKRVLDDVRQDDLIQTDAAVNNGNSGGALVNLRGQWVGIPTVVLRTVTGGVSVEGIAFALPSNRVVSIAQRIITDGTSYPRPTLPFETLELTPDVISSLGRTAVSEGAIVTAVAAAGATSGGVQQGDIITKFAGQDVNSDQPLLNLLMAHEPGETVRVVLNRNGRIIEADVRLAKRG